jgi:hypothetical protein
VLLATMASLHVGLFQVLLRRNCLEISCMDWTVPMDFWLMCWWTSSRWACTDSGNFIGSCKCQCCKEKHCQLLRQGFFSSEESDTGCQSMDMYIMNSTKDGFGGDHEYCFWENYGAHAHQLNNFSFSEFRWLMGMCTRLL